jgi:uncharacterized protein
MIQSRAEWKTEHGRKYLVQLCKHFAHKIEVAYTEQHGECRFSCGTVVLDADDDGLTIVASAPDPEQLAETQSVMERHLVRFAFRENIEALNWSPVERAA